MGHEIRPMEETMTILDFENDPKRINVLKEMEIMKATTSDHMLNIMQNTHHYRIRQRPARKGPEDALL